LAKKYEKLRTPLKIENKTKNRGQVDLFPNNRKAKPKVLANKG
jgi:hypothetical protein